MTEADSESTSEPPKRSPTDPPADHENSVISSGDLLAGRQEVLIRHGDETYRLRVTRNGKLILQK